MPAGLPRLFKSALDWNLYSTQQHGAADRQARGSWGLRACCQHAMPRHAPMPAATGSNGVPLQLIHLCSDRCEHPPMSHGACRDFWHSTWRASSRGSVGGLTLMIV